jgi:hypothetical protein
LGIPPGWRHRRGVPRARNVGRLKRRHHWRGDYVPPRHTLLHITHTWRETPPRKFRTRFPGGKSATQRRGAHARRAGTVHVGSPSRSKNLPMCAGVLWMRGELPQRC